MITREKIDALIGFAAGEMPVLSFFLEVDGARDPEGPYAVRAEEMIRQARLGLGEREGFTEAQRESAAADLDRIARFVRKEFERGDRRGLAVFACSPRGLWQVEPLGCRIKDRLILQNHAYVRPLILLMEENPRFGVALVDREKGHFFAIEQGEIVAQEEIRDNVPGRIRPGSWYGLADRGIERRVDSHIHQHLKHLAAVLDTFTRAERLTRLLIGGTPDVVPEFRDTLSGRVRDLVVGVLANPLFPTPSEVLARSGEAMRGIEAESEAALVRRALDEAYPQGRAAVGLEATLDALYRGAVATLIVGRERVQPGRACRRCGRLFVEETACPVCQERAPAAVQDLIEEAVDAALYEGADVVFVDETPEWSRHEGIGALLRFEPPSAPPG